MATSVTRPDSWLGRMYEEHMGFIAAKDVGGLLSQYAADCLLISMLTDNRQPMYVRGHDELGQFFESRIFGIEEFTVTHTQWAEADHQMMTVEEVAIVPVGGGPASVELYDNWYLRDGKIAIHFAGVVRYSDGTYADGTGFAPGKAPAKSEPPDTPLGRMYREHIEFIRAKNVDGIVQQYDENAVLIGTLTPGRVPRYVVGREELTSFFNGNFMGLNDLTSRIDQWAEDPQALMIVESVDVEGKDGSKASMSFYDNWVLQGGRIVTHFAGVVRYPDGTYA
jgi:ketosteroid isomerase-like protein